MKKRLFSLLLCITVLFSTVLAVEASATTGTMTDTEMQKMYDFIFSEETNKLINSSIDFNQYGTQTVNIGNDLAYVYINERSATRSVVSDTMTSIFKKTSNGQTVATLRLACTFTYNGSTVSISSSDYRATADAIPDWTCTADASHSRDSSGDMYVSATYVLYYNGNQNANGYMDMSCDKNGNITKHYPWS